MKNNEDNNSKPESINIIDMVAQETELIVAESCEAAKLQAEQELEKALREYGQRTRQIVIKIKKEAEYRTAEIAGRLGKAIMMRVEKSSTEAVAEVITEFGEKAEQIIQTIQEAIARDAEGLSAGVESKSESNAENDNNNEAVPAVDSQQEAEETNDSTTSGFDIEVENELAGITEDNANGNLQLDSEDFEHWLSQ